MSSDDSTLDSLWDELVTALGANGLGRIEQMLHRRSQGDLSGCARYQYPHLVFVPGLEARSWHEPHTFRWSAAVMRALPEVRRELDGFLEAAFGQPYLADFDYERHGLDRPPGGQQASDRAELTSEWVAYFLCRHGTWIDRNARWWPSARRMVELTSPAPGEVLCSVLNPGGRISVHSGGANVILTCHLPLVVPAACSLRVGVETRAFEENTLVVFDDSFLHSAWNEASSRRRINLIWGIWHPELTDREIAALEIVLPRLLDFEDLREPVAGEEHRSATQGDPELPVPPSWANRA